MAARSEEKATAAIKKLAEETGKECHFLKLDLADLSAVKQAASQFKT
jgi:short-subunit dehydrogenase